MKNLNNFLTFQLLLCFNELSIIICHEMSVWVWQRFFELQGCISLSRGNKMMKKNTSRFCSYFLSFCRIATYRRCINFAKNSIQLSSLYRNDLHKNSTVSARASCNEMRSLSPLSFLALRSHSQSNLARWTNKFFFWWFDKWMAGAHRASHSSSIIWMRWTTNREKLCSSSCRQCARRRRAREWDPFHWTKEKRWTFCVVSISSTIYSARPFRSPRTMRIPCQDSEKIKYKRLQVVFGCHHTKKKNKKISHIFTCSKLL